MEDVMHHEQRTHVVDFRHPRCAADLMDTYHGHAVTDPGRQCRHLVQERRHIGPAHRVT